MWNKAILFFMLSISIMSASAEDFSSVRSMARSGVKIPLSGEIEAYVSSSCLSTNTADCPNIAGNMVATGESLRTVYIQNENGTLGFRVILADYYGNSLLRGDRVRIRLDGACIVREDAPERYTIHDLPVSSCEILSRGNALPCRLKHIADLTPDDIYTYIVLEGLEFAKKTGGYINVNEKAVQITALNEMLSREGELGWPSACECVDAWPSLMFDDRGSSVYMLVNSTCEWRRNGAGVPKGLFRLGGVIVHSELPHYGNSLGDYSIRPMGLEDFFIVDEYRSSWGKLCAWEYDYNQYAVLDFRGAGKRQFVKPAEVYDDKINAESGDAVLWAGPGVSLCLDDEYDARHSFDGLRSARMTGSRSNAALRLDAKCAGWYADGAGLYVKASLKNLSSSAVRFNFSFIAGRDHSKNSVDYPVDWKLSYSTDGKIWKDMDGTFDLRPVVFTNVQHGKRRAVLHNGLAAGFTQHSVLLPDELRAADSFILRIRPCSARTATMPETFDGPCREGRAVDCKDADTIIRFGDISITYLL